MNQSSNASLASKTDGHILSRIISGQMPGAAWDAFSPEDWRGLIGRAHEEGMAPLLYWVLSRSGMVSTFPESVHHSLRAFYAGTWGQNQVIFQELETLARHFEQADIQSVVVKGACYALTIYPDPGLRPMGDLDVLVPASRLKDAVKIAKTRGYTPAVPEASPGLSALLDHAICLQKTGEESVMLELHRSLVAEGSFTYAVPVDWFWGQIEPLGGSSAGRFGNLHRLTPTAQLLHASAHAALQHGGKNTSLLWYYDIDRLIRHYAECMDWGLLLSQARAFEWSSALDASLSQTQAYFATPIPDHVRAGLAEQFDRHKKLVELQQVRPATHVLEECQKLKALNGYGRLRLLLALCVPGPSYMRWRYKFQTPWMLPAYYLIRWWEILVDVFRTALSLFRKQVMFMGKS